MTAGVWERCYYDQAAEGATYTRVGAEGRGQTLCLETACECLRPSAWFDDGEVSDLDAHDDCRACDGGVLRERRFAVDLWRGLSADMVKPETLGYLRIVERLASYGLRWSCLDDATGAPVGALQLLKEGAAA